MFYVGSYYVYNTKSSAWDVKEINVKRGPLQESRKTNILTNLKV